jgi:hypothetical protein
MKNYFVVMIIFFALFMASWGYTQDPKSLLSDETANKAAYQEYLNDQDKKLNEINYLLDLIKNSSLSFERNGRKANGKKAAELLKYKLNEFKDKIKTPQDFIEKVASFSNHTNKGYYVFLPDGKKILLKDMLDAELKKLQGRSSKERK